MGFVEVRHDVPQALEEVAVALAAGNHLRALVDGALDLVLEPGRAPEALGAIAQHLRDLVATGTTPLLGELGARYPDEVVDLTQLHGLGPKRVRTLFDELHVKLQKAFPQLSRELAREALGRMQRDGGPKADAGQPRTEAGMYEKREDGHVVEQLPAHFLLHVQTF